MKYKYLGNDEYSLKPVTENTIKYATLKDLNDPYEAVSVLRHDEGKLKESVENVLFKMKNGDLYSENNPKLAPIRRRFQEICPSSELFQEWEQKTIEEVFTAEQRQEVLNILLEKKHSTQISAQGQRHQKEMDDKMGVLCLSDTCQSYLMWSHYANKHQGYCIGFDESDGWFDPLTHLQNTMGNKFTRPPIDERYNKLIKVGYYSHRIQQPEQATPEDALDPFFHKSDVWEYEDEYRMLHLLQCSEPYPAFGVERYPNLKLIKKEGSLYLRKFPKNIIKEIVFGVRCSLETQKTIRDALSGEEVKYFFAIPSSIEFEMIKEPAIFDYPYDPMDMETIKQASINEFLKKLNQL